MRYNINIVQPTFFYLKNLIFCGERDCLVEVYACRINFNKSSEEIDRMLSAAPDWRKIEAQKFKMAEDTVRCLAAYLLASKVIAEKANCGRSDVKVRRGKFGKLELLYPDGLCFNISHSGNWVVCAVDSESVGIDVERIKPINLNIAKRFFDREEFDYIMKQPESSRLDAFYETWTLKESYIKAIGTGFHKTPGSFCVVRDGSKVSVRDDEAQNSGWILKRLHFNGDYALSVTGRHEAQNAVFIKEEELISG